MEGSSSAVVPLWAHSRNVSGARHTLEDHLRGSAALARRFGSVFGAGELAEYLALVHDVGKGSCAWQHGLDGAERHKRGVGVPHKEAGAWLAASHAGVPFGAVVQGHHGGLPTHQKVKDLVQAVKSGTHPDQKLIEEAITRTAADVPEIVPSGRVPLPAWVSALKGPDGALARDLLVRMLFSCVVDADFLDTGAHFTDTPVQVRADADMAQLAAVFEERRCKALSRRRPSKIDGIRERVYEEVVGAATSAPGMYVLPAPTGAGKTFSSAGFALHHAAAHGHRRVVVAVPYTSITQQNARTYREMLDPEDPGLPRTVLEHHSSVDLDGADAAWARTAAENWDAPFVVTTTVQLFESLFSNRPAAMRKVHRLAGAVVVLDEVQALPDRLLVPILSGLRHLVEHFGTTVVLASATQPDFWHLAQLGGLPRRQLVHEAAGLFEELRRVSYDWRTEAGVTWESMADEIGRRSGGQTLTVVNTTKDAAHLHRLLEERVGEGPVLHLSTRMTAEHRAATIGRVRALLENDEGVHVVSTQLIEAGVDLDFPQVFRAWAPAESLQQAAGRCNREGHQDRGTVVVFHIDDAGQPRDNVYKAALEATAAHFGPDLADPDDLDALNRYYPLRYTLQGSGPAAMGAHIDTLRTRLDFPAVHDAFRMIDDTHHQPVVVIRDEADRPAVEADIAALKSPYPCGPEPLRRLQPHIAQLPRHEATAALTAGLAEPLIGNLLLWNGAYHPHRGLDPEQPEDPTAFIL
ncbi:CRISPR-associated helicase Cas3' [Kitasatospora sp. YST-16]|uniref:CRISPR-associated helicase Cas3' n=1 Tax=Kitasatospora sp. YST-16 TaxID=2998080 RepID=UPI002283B6A3|nr:CRISPR-associated helicase Cas3' [Kitasatospora sp. YST-16]WAL76223.1 CRISPR-associated helicase Cas3' [Kitasatospora sp. YST-16]WNW36150.1 CRISPR-associated helicase Cas3' [Streptomyces sp. Li-HN-5-13]